MPGDSSNWVRVSRTDPCPICGKSDNCQVSRDGGAVWCGRVSENSRKQNHGGQFLHVLEGDRQPRVPLYITPLNSVRRRDFSALSQHYFTNVDATDARFHLATQLGVSLESLGKLHVGWNPAARWWSFPERDATGQIIGISTRTEAGQKKRLRGGRAGLTYADNWDAQTGPILLVEGASDTAALMTLGLNGVGRPSNLGGVDHLIGLLEHITADREIIVLGEHDRKPDGRWPGREGAISTATQLADALEHCIGWSLPPDEAKDARTWLNAAPAALPRARKADLFLSGLNVTQVQPIPHVASPTPNGPAISLGDWRRLMFEARWASLETPGCYLDASPTGSGKSHLDLQILQRRLTGEAA